MNTSDLSHLDHLLDYVIVLSAAGNILYCNESFANLVQKTPKRIIGKSVFDFISPIEELSSLLKPSLPIHLDQYVEVDLMFQNGIQITANLHRKQIQLESLESNYLITIRDLTVESNLHQRYRLQLTEKETLIRNLDLKIFELEFILELLSLSLKNSDNKHAKDLLFETIINKIPADQIIMLTINPNQKPYQLKLTGHYHGESLTYDSIEFNLMNLIASKINTLDFLSSTETIEIEPFAIDDTHSFLGIAHVGRDLNWYFFGIGFSSSNLNYFTENSGFLKAVTQQTLVILENQMLYLSSITDDRTKLFNHRYFEYRFEYELKRATRYKTALSFLIIDIDHFKKINDEFGHQEGDIIIKKVASILKEHFRTTDILARYGGDEFVAILPETPIDGAVVAAERLVEKVRLLNYKTESHLPIKVTISVGISSFPSHGNSTRELIASSDKALYETKTRGRDGYSFANES